ncbi:MAG TPA: immunoglobulin domain-containing protein, partial [Candidatus Binatia bacterium]|nr:immunoglobulin domain-containing protein [Candidatus Binatia bacterium]
MKLQQLKLMNKLATIVAATATMLTAASAWAAGSSSLVIAEVYGGGGNSGSVYKNDFIVIFNRGTSDVDVNGWSVQYASAAGTTWQVTTLATSSTIISAGKYFLVQEAAGTGTAPGLPTPDATGSINMSGSNGKVALVNNSTALSGQFATGTGTGIIDFVGFGTGNGFEGTGAAPAPSSAGYSDQRANEGCADTDDNAADFTAAAPNPRNSSSSTHSCAVITPPVISGIDPMSLTTNAGNTVNFTVTLSMGDSPFTYYWYKETASTTNLIATIATNTSTGTLTLSNVLAADAANYQVVVSNASTFTATSSVVSLTVTDPAINLQPANQAGLLKGAAQFSVLAGGTGLSYQWYFCTDPFDNTQIASAVGNGVRASGSGISGSSSSALTITNLQSSDPTNFVVVVTGTYGSVTSSVVSLS